MTLNFIVVNGPDGWVISDVESPHDSLRMFLAQFRRLGFLINHLARTDGVGDLGEIADIGDGIAVEHHEIGVKSLSRPCPSSPP